MKPLFADIVLQHQKLISLIRWPVLDIEKILTYHWHIIWGQVTVIMYIRSKEIREYSITADKYSEYRKFCSDIVKADKAQVVLIRKEQW